MKTKEACLGLLSVPTLFGTFGTVGLLNPHQGVSWNKPVYYAQVQDDQEVVTSKVNIPIDDNSVIPEEIQEEIILQPQLKEQKIPQETIKKVTTTGKRITEKLKSEKPKVIITPVKTVTPKPVVTPTPIVSPTPIVEPEIIVTPIVEVTPIINPTPLPTPTPIITPTPIVEEENVEPIVVPTPTPIVEVEPTPAINPTPIIEEEIKN
jgi:hypothetical protein